MIRLVFILCFILCFAALPAQNKNNNTIQISPILLQADTFNMKARSFIFKSKKDSVIFYMDKALAIAKQYNNETLLARCYVDYAGFYFLQGNYSKTLKYIDKADASLGNIDHYEIKITALLQRANLYNVTGKKDSAWILFKQAEAYNNKNNSYRNWVVYLAMAELYNQSQDNANAEQYYLKAYHITSKGNIIVDKSRLLSVILNYYQGKNNFTAAAPYITEFYALQDERKKKKIADPLEDLIMNLIGGKLETDIHFMTSVKNSSLEKGDLLDAIIANGFMISYYNKKSQFEKAIQFAEEGEAIAAKTNNIENRYESKKIKYEVLQKAGRFSESASEAALLFDLKDSVLAIQKRDKIYELETKYETEKKGKEIELLTIKQDFNAKELALLLKDKKLGQLVLQQEIIRRNTLSRENLLMESIVKSEQNYNALLTNENKLKNSELKKELDLKAALKRENALQENQLRKEKQVKWAFATGAGLLLLSGVAILLLYRKQQKKNSIIQKQSADLEVLMKEIHHRVKNNLQVVSSLLDLQSHTITDSQASAAVKEGKNRVQSMALIHQNLYSEGNIKGILVKEYIGNLVQSLCDSYNISNTATKVNIYIDDLNLDVDTMIPLGLVLNELISNCFKYAFPPHPAQATVTNGILNIELHEKDAKLLLKVSDNGIGFPSDINTKSGKSFGLKMIRAFAQKLKAKLDIYNNNGAVVEMLISKYKTA